MTINITQLNVIYNKDSESTEHQHWIAIPDSKEGTFAVNVSGSSGGDPQNGWKIHKSIR